MPAGAAMVTMPTTPDWKKLDADERAAAVRVMQAYAGMATAMDREVGRLVAHLKAAGDYDNTIFVFLSDNGAEPTNPFSSLRNRLFLDMQYDFAIANIGRRASFSALGPGWARAAASPLPGYKLTASGGGPGGPLILPWPGHGGTRGGGHHHGPA